MAIAFLAAGILLQIRMGARVVGTDLVEADPPAHYVTGVMVHDFLRTGNYTAPFPFATCFYTKFPKVALGHWPPMFYAAESAWFLVFGPTIDAARYFCATICAALALLFWWKCRTEWGLERALFATGVLLAFPLMLSEGWRVMSDVMLALWVWLALWAAVRYRQDEEIGPAIWFGVCGGCAMLTKGTGALLLALWAALPLLSGRPELYKRVTYWLGAGIAAILAAPFF